MMKKLKTTFTEEVTTEKVTTEKVPPKPAPAAHPASTNPVALELYGLDPALDLTQECASFYLLLDLDRLGHKTPEYTAAVGRLAEQFKAYTDMALGGELRHAASMGKRVGDGSMPFPMTQLLKAGSISTASRAEAWGDWFHLRQTYGTIALSWAEQAFVGFTRGGYGGKKWANITKTLRLYEDGTYPAPLFIDHCWSLQHNGGVYFNKFWHSYHGLTTVLNANFKGDMETVAYYARTNIKAMHGTLSKREAPTGETYVLPAGRVVREGD
jgi:hypothetical protein